MTLEVVYLRIVMGSERIEDIKRKIREGYTLKHLQEEYPITRALFLKLGGSDLKKAIRINHDCLEIITEKDSLSLKRDTKDLDIELILGNLLGDGNIYKSLNAQNTYTFSFGHTFRQIGYVKLKYELLKQYVTKIRLMDCKNFKDYSFHVSLKSLPIFNVYYSLFYTTYKEGKNNLQKDILKEEIASLITPRIFAFWIMDDGKKYSNTKYVFSVCVGKQPYYTFNKFEKIVDIISNRLNVRLQAREEKNSYEMSITSIDAEKLFYSIRDFIWPEFCYKFGVLPEDCGEAYKNLPWYEKWRDSVRNVRHPFFENFSLINFKNSDDELKKKQFIRFLINRTIARGFPFYSFSEFEQEDYWKSLKNYQITEQDKVLFASLKANIFPNSFMNHRFKVPVRKKKSPYQLFYNHRELKKVINYHMRTGSNIKNTNIRNALGFYGSQVAGQFNPCYAKFFVDKYCKGKKVLDPCAGWGGRLSGVVMCGKDYYGIEPNIETFRSLNRMRDWFKKRERVKIEIINGVAEKEENYKYQFDLAITSPPYFDLEKYSEDETQSYIKYSNYGLWKEKFLKKMIQNVYNHLKINCIFVLNVSDYSLYHIVLDSIIIGKDIGFNLIDTYKVSTYNTSKDFGLLSETFLIFQKKLKC